MQLYLVNATQLTEDEMKTIMILFYKINKGKNQTFYTVAKDFRDANL